ncbi:MAG: nuclear transport factor 2 family protein [Proteobacteria bacterium]|nr:MAG: nuclear transport factor 2 family protein [Pseudomonadota bacterium]
MKFFKTLLICACCIVAVTLHLLCSPAAKDPLYREKLTTAYHELDQAFMAKDADKFMRYFQDSAIGMPEYHSTVYGKENLHQYYQQWFDSTQTLNFNRTIYEIQPAGNNLVVIGRFSHRFKKADSSIVDYAGKYMNVWAIGPHDSLYLKAEIWGSEHPINGSLLSFASRSSSGAMPAKVTVPAVEEEVKSRNQQIADYVKNRQGTLHATEMFMRDAIYLTYDTTMLVGMENIEAYFAEHEKPGAISIDSISLRASHIIPIDSLVFEYAYYFVAVSWDNHKGGINVKGKSINLWKRNSDGKLMLWRQMVNHD